MKKHLLISLLILISCSSEKKDHFEPVEMADTAKGSPAFEKLITQMKEDSIKKSSEPKDTKPKSTTTSKSVKETVYNSNYDGSVHQVEKYLKSNLKDPASYEGLSWSEVIKTDNGFMVRHKYRAKNSYGGYVIDNKIFSLSPSGSIIGVTDFVEK